MPPGSRTPVRVALVGAGKIASMHVSAALRAGGQVVAVCDRDEQRARLVAGSAPGAVAYGDVSAMLAEQRPQLVHILTPPASHAALTRTVARAGCHALVEKPMALSVGEADDMIATAREHGVMLVANHNYLRKPSVVRARELVESGEIGDVVHVEGFYGLSEEANSYGGDGGAHWAFRLPGGVFTNFLPHLVYLQAAFLGGIDAVEGVSLARDPRGARAASELTVLLTGPAATGVMTISTRTRPYAKFLRIYGTQGIVHADLVGEVTTVHRSRRVPRLLGKALFNLELVPQLARGTAVNSARVLTGSMRNMPDLHAFVEELYEAVRTGGEPPATGEDGRAVVDVIERVWARMPDPPEPAAAPVVASTPRTAVERRVSAAGDLRGERVLVTGAGGLLGRHVVTALARCGADVRALVRDASRVPGDVERDAEVVLGNLTDPASLHAAMSGVDRVVHCAAVTTNNVPYAMHQETNVDGTRAVLHAAREAGAGRIVHVSSVVVYGVADRDEPVDEGTRLPEDVDRWGHYQRSKLAAEHLVRDAAAGGADVVVVRPGVLYGAGARASLIRRLVQLGGVRLTLGAGRHAVPLLYVDNAVDGILLALTASVVPGSAFNLVDEPQRSARDIARLAMAVSPDGATRAVPIPPRVLQVLAGRLEARARAAGARIPPRLSRFQLAQATRDVRYDTAAARAVLGWDPEVELEEGLRRTYGAQPAPAQAPEPVARIA